MVMDRKKHKTEIIAWANGKQIQSRLATNTNADTTNTWFDVDDPKFHSELFYRVKPQINPIHGEYYKLKLGDGSIHVLIYDVHYCAFINLNNKFVGVESVTVLNKMVDEINE